MEAVVSFKKNAWNKKSQVKFYLGQNEDCSLGDSTLDSSEKLLQRSGVLGEVKITSVILVREVYMQSNTYFFKKVAASHGELSSPWKILVLF